MKHRDAPEVEPFRATVSRCLGVVRNVADVERSAAFYTSLFGFERMAGAKGARLSLGEMLLDLRPAAPTAESAVIRSNERGFRHIAIVVRDMAEAFKRLVAADVALISSAPQTLPAWNKASSGIEALYFRDPDGHPLELIRFPPDKGKAEWRRPGTDLFMGADHTAIVVSDTEASLTFYRGRLGFAVAATAHNYGPEQEALSGVKDASVLVTSLAAGAGTFGLELLEYLLPANGAASPAGFGPGDSRWSETVVAAAPPQSSDGTQFSDPDGYGVRIT